MRDLPPSRGTAVFFAFVLALALVFAAACGGGAESPTAPAVASGGGGGGTGDSGGGDAGGGDTGGGDAGGGNGGGSGTSPPPTPPPPASTSGRLVIRMTDAPIDDVSELNVFLESIKIKRDGEPVERFASTVGLVDLLTLQGGITQLLGDEEVEAGMVQFIEFILDQDQSYVVDAVTGDQLALKIPSEKIKLKGGPFEVPADGLASVLVDFDAEKSLKRTGNGRYQLKPFVSIVEVEVTEGSG